MQKRRLLLAYVFSVLGVLLINGATFCYLSESHVNPWIEYPYRGFTWLLLPLGSIALIVGAASLLMAIEEPQH
jgi:hypothetical protein